MIGNDGRLGSVPTWVLILSAGLALAALLFIPEMMKIVLGIVVAIGALWASGIIVFKVDDQE